MSSQVGLSRFKGTNGKNVLKVVLLHYILCISLHNCDPNTPAPCAFLCYWLALFRPFIVVWVTISIICNQTVKVLNEESKRKLTLDNDFGHNVWCHITTFVYLRINLILIVWPESIEGFFMAKLRSDVVALSSNTSTNVLHKQHINTENPFTDVYKWKKVSKYCGILNLWNVLIQIWQLFLPLAHTLLPFVHQSVQNYMSHNAPRQTTCRPTGSDQEKNTSGSFECRSATGRAFKTYTTQQVYIFIVYRSSWIVNWNTNIRYRFWLFHCGQSAKLGKRHYVAASYQIASPQSYAVTKCLFMFLLLLYPCLLFNRKLRIYMSYRFQET